MFECERKFRLSQLPKQLKALASIRIWQGYFWVFRLRQQRLPDDTNFYWFCYKRPWRGNKRLELEFRIPRWLFNFLWRFTKGRRINKKRYVRVHRGFCWEVDVLFDRHGDRRLVLAEVELRQPEDQPEIPPWISPYLMEEVTEDPQYTNARLAQ